MKKRIIALLLTLCMLATVIVGCGAKQGSEGHVSSGGALSGEISICIFNGGYGTEWLEKVAESYQAINPGAKIKITTTVTPEDTRTLVESGKSNFDIVMLNIDFFNVASKNKLEPLNDVYETIPDGESKTIAEKVGDKVVAYYTQDENIYQMSWAGGRTGLCYNETVLDEALGKGKWEVPTTTDELIKLCDAIKAKDYYSFSFCAEEDYWDYCLFGWAAQYMGYDEYFDYFSGVYKNDSGKEVKADISKSDEFLTATEKGKLEALSLLEKLTKKSNGYSHPKSDVMNFMEAQQAFLSWGFDGDMTKVAMTPNGDWLENETEYMLSQKPQTIKMMKLPVISSIVDQCKTIKDDAALQEVVAFVDGKESKAPAGVSEEDIERIREARNTYHSLSLSQTMVIPSSSKNIALAKDFLVYITSEQAQQIYSQTLQGVTMPYGFDPTNVDTIQMSDFQKSVYECYGANTNPIPYRDQSSNLVAYGGLYLMKNKHAAELFTETKTASDLCGEIKMDIRGSWESILGSAGESK